VGKINFFNVKAGGKYIYHCCKGLKKLRNKETRSHTVSQAYKLKVCGNSAEESVWIEQRGMGKNT
jgi:hypothetical protein